MGNDNKILRMLFNRAKTNPKRIVFAEADHLDVLKAAQIVSRRRNWNSDFVGKKRHYFRIDERN